MDKITKFLLKLSEKEKASLLLIIDLILKNTLEALDVKPLKGEKGLFRVRKGKLRIIFKREVSQNTIVNIDYRGNIY